MNTHNRMDIAVLTIDERSALLIEFKKYKPRSRIDGINNAPKEFTDSWQSKFPANVRDAGRFGISPTEGKGETFRMMSKAYPKLHVPGPIDPDTKRVSWVNVYARLYCFAEPSSLVLANPGKLWTAGGKWTEQEGLQVDEPPCGVL